jgi:hypothetical protein
MYMSLLTSTVRDNRYHLGMPKNLTTKTCRDCGAEFTGAAARLVCDACRTCKQCGKLCFRSEKKFCSYPCSVEYARAHRPEPVLRVYEGEKYPYAKATFGRVVAGVHVLVWMNAHGPVPPGKEIHHINGDSRDNRIENLMAVTRLEHRRLHSPYFRVTETAWERMCKRCGQWKPADFDHFHSNGSGTTGVRHFGPCRGCGYGAHVKVPPAVK